MSDLKTPYHLELDTLGIESIDPSKIDGKINSTGKAVTHQGGKM